MNRKCLILPKILNFLIFINQNQSQFYLILVQNVSILNIYFVKIKSLDKLKPINFKRGKNLFQMFLQNYTNLQSYTHSVVNLATKPVYKIYDGIYYSFFKGWDQSSPTIKDGQNKKIINWIQKKYPLEEFIILNFTKTTFDINLCNYPIISFAEDTQIEDLLFLLGVSTTINNWIKNDKRSVLIHFPGKFSI
jgi:hypothetical protein